MSYYSVIILIIVISAATAQTMETFGCWGRAWGALAKRSAEGYSLHVRTATLGRFCTFLIAPSLGYLVDNGMTYNTLLLCGAGIYFLTTISSLFIHVYSARCLKVYCKLKKFQPPKAFNFGNDCFDYKILIFCLLSFAITSGGILVANILASLFPEQRASLVQLASILTAAGTLLHVFKVDPYLAKKCDGDIHMAYDAVKTYVLGRLIGSLFLFSGYITLSFTL